MVRFRVVKGSHVLLAIAIIALAAAAGVVLLGGGSSDAARQRFARQSEAGVIETLASQTSGGEQMVIEILPDPSPTPTPTNGRKILIYHTHTHEAYAQVEEDPYVALETWRTLDDEHSVVRLGGALADMLRSMGYDVIHDKTDHEQQDINSAYVRSLETLKGYGEDFDLIIDLHRDAYVEGLNSLLAHDGVEYAQLMLLVGRGDKYGDGEKPDYEGNLAFAQRLTGAINARVPELCRNVTVKQGRYNQHMGRRAILVEVGHNKNTLKQALASIPVLAEALDTILQ